MADLEAWLARHSHPNLELLVEDALVAPRRLDLLLEEYVRHLWDSGAAYYRAAETLNAITNSTRELRCRLPHAWDTCFVWLDREPVAHHTAAAAEPVAALVTLALLWGWPLVSIHILLGYSMVLRPSEHLTARRHQLVFPQDLLRENSTVFLKIPRPKTRRTGPRVQVAYSEDADTNSLALALLGHLPPGARLWPASPAAFRSRWNALCKALRLPCGASTAVVQALSPASLRGGGATRRILEGEDPSKVQRRGRWLNERSMAVYLQELQAATFVASLPQPVRQQLDQLLSCAPFVLEHALGFLSAGVPPASWPSRWRSLPAPGS